MFENRINSKANYILISFLVTGAFIVGRKSVPVLPAEIRIEKITDTHAIEKAVAEERKKINSKFSQKKIRDTTKLPDGTIKVHEQIANTRISEETAQISKMIDSDIKTHEHQIIELKTPLKKFAFELEAAAKNSIPKFSVLPEFNPELNLAAKLSYRIDKNLWAFAGAEHQLLSNGSFIEVGIRYRLEIM